LQILVHRAQAEHEEDAADRDTQHPAWKLIVKVRHPHRPSQSSHRLGRLLPLATQAQRKAALAGAL
jgi:hypothetical protein